MSLKQNGFMYTGIIYDINLLEYELEQNTGIIMYIGIIHDKPQIAAAFFISAFFHVTYFCRPLRPSFSY
jgi:hypothetical protein